MFSESRLWECRVFTVFGDRQVRFDCIFTGFADNRLWEYRIFSFKNACLAQKSRVFPFFPGKGLGPGFSLSGRPSALTAPWLSTRGRFFPVKA